jgi:hypothetical protein
VVVVVVVNRRHVRRVRRVHLRLGIQAMYGGVLVGALAVYHDE